MENEQTDTPSTTEDNTPKEVTVKRGDNTIVLDVVKTAKTNVSTLRAKESENVGTIQSFLGDKGFRNLVLVAFARKLQDLQKSFDEDQKLLSENLDKLIERLENAERALFGKPKDPKVARRNAIRKALDNVDNLDELDNLLAKLMPTEGEEDDSPYSEEDED